MNADVVIIGGGVHGASLAYHFGKMGRGKIVLLEKRSLASGPTGKSGTMIRPLFVIPAYIQWVLESTAMFENWQREIGGDAGFVQNGFLRLTTSLEPEKLGGDLELMKRMGVTFRILTSKEVEQMVPGLNLKADEMGVFLPGGGFADPVKTTVSLARAAQRMDVEVREGTTVLGLDVEKGRLQRVRTDKGNIETNIVINCAGAWSKQLAAMAGVELPIEVHRQPTCLFGHPEDFPSPAPIISDSVNRVYVREIENSVLRSAHFGWAFDPADPDSYDETIAGEEVDRSRGLLKERSTSLGNTVSFGGFSGVYDMTPDGHPIISNSAEVHGFWSNCGWSGNGFASAPAVGRHLAPLILSESPTMDLSMFKWPRPAGVERMIYGAAEGPDR